jgi:hypothetical protein
VISKGRHDESGQDMTIGPTLISPYVLFADSQHPVLISGHSSSGRDPIFRPNTARSYIRDSFGAIWQASFSLSSFQMDEVWNVGPIVRGWIIFGDVASSCRDLRILSCVFLVVSLASTYLPGLGQLPYFRDAIQEFSAR